MKKFNTVKSIIAPLQLDNVDTDMIIPKQFLKTIKRTGLGVNLFHEMRFDLNGDIIPDFILNQEKYQKTEILISGDNFGCGSSREHAPWAIADFGIKVIIATSYADIFYNNCFKNSILPIKLEKEQISLIWDMISTSNISATVNLDDQQIILSDQTIINFKIDAFRKKCLLEGLDDISLTMLAKDKIEKFEIAQKAKQPWLHN